MNRCLMAKHLIVFTFFGLVVTACGQRVGEILSSPDLEATVFAQDQWISHLFTQVMDQQNQIKTQAGHISYLATQMPSGTLRLTPVPQNSNPTPIPTVYPLEEETPVPALPTKSVFVYPEGFRTGVAELDAVIGAFIDNDLDVKLELVQFLAAGCTTADGFGGPPKCEPGEEDGTFVEVFPILGPEGIHVRADNIDQALNFNVDRLFAVYIVPEHVVEEAFWPVGEFGVVFDIKEDGYPFPVTVQVKNGRIVRLDHHIGLEPLEVIKQTNAELILPPIAGAGISPSQDQDADEELARETLVNFFDLLHNGRYMEASQIYGGSYEVLIGYNPDVDPSDQTSLFRSACQVNGFQCLMVKSIQLEARLASGEYRFQMEFQYDDGSLFERGPCCGADESDQPRQIRFPFSVVKQGEGVFLVMDLPVYVP